MIDLKAGAYDWIVKAYGPAALFACHRHIAESQRAGFTKWETMPVENHVHQAARIFALHLGKTRVVRENDSYRFVLEPCGTGGRMAATGSLARPGDIPAQRRGPRDHRPAAIGSVAGCGDAKRLAGCARLSA